MLNDKITYTILTVLIVMAGGFLAYKYSLKKTTSQIEVNVPEKIDAESSVPENSVDEKTPENNTTAPVPEKPTEVVKKSVNENVSSSSVIVNKLISWGFQKTDGRKIDTIIIHSSYNSLGGDQYSVDKIIDIYRSYGVSAHYLMDRKGTIYQLVLDKDIAYHAGVAKLPDGRTNVNEVSIGIELMNTREDKFTAAQYEALNRLLSLLKDKYKIKYVLGHDQIAPDRKDDPWNFNPALILDGNIMDMFKKY